MKMNESTVTEYPKLAEFVKTSIPLVVSKPRIWKAFARSVNTSGAQWKKTAEESVLWSRGPTIHVEDLNVYYIATRRTSRFNGMFRPTYPNRIYLSQDIAIHFENDFSMPSARVCVESTLLHELVHWSNHWTGKRLLFRSRGSGTRVNIESGKTFESEAYGADQNRWY